MSFVYPKYIISCDEFIENEDGSLSFIRAFENKTLKTLPFVMDFQLIISIEYSVTRKEVREVFIRIIDPEGSNGSESGSDRSHDMKIILRETKKNEIKTLVSIISVTEMSINIGKVGGIVSIEGSGYQVYVNSTYIWLSGEELAYV